MTDVRTDMDDSDGDRLPWLEAVEDEERGPSPVKLIALVVIGLLTIGILVGGVFWLAGGSGSTANEELIASPGEYKVRPPEAGGMQVDRSGSTQVATSDGVEPTANLNRGATPETPVIQPRQAPAQTTPAPQPRPAITPAPATPAPQPAPAPRAQPTLSGPTIQVGAYPSAAAAEGEWARLSARYPYLGALQHAVTTYERGGRTYYRLRAAGANARDVCRRLRAAGQPCLDVN